jgi:peptidoglycan/LPS O-acetylase OafA/YrhL
VNRETSIFLDAVRFMAALFVFADHLGSQRLTGGFLWQLEPAGGEAVIIFFVLSGFVIGYVTDKRERDLRTYAVNRMARIYSVTLPALAITFALDSFGLLQNAQLYLVDPLFFSPPRLVQYTTGMFFLHQLWGANITPGTNLAYWSLGYEVWYYIIFGAAMFAPSKHRWLAAAVAVAIAGPKIALLLPIWLSGVGLYRLCERHVPSRRAGWILFTGSILLWIGFEIWSAWHGRLVVASRSFLPRNEIPQDYVVACLFALNLYGFRAISPDFGSMLIRAERTIRWIAGATFSLYLIHQPVMQMLVSISPWNIETWQNRALLIVGTLAIVFAFAELTERRKEVWRRWIEGGITLIHGTLIRSA